jgi:hypothetical protein
VLLFSASCLSSAGKRTARALDGELSFFPAPAGLCARQQMCRLTCHQQRKTLKLRHTCQSADDTSLGPA